MEVKERLIRLEGTFNFRDYGGYNAGDGKKVKKDACIVLMIYHD